MSPGRKLGITTIALAGTLGLSALVAPNTASPTHKQGVDEDGRQNIKMTWWVKRIAVARNEDGQQDVLSGDGKPFGRVTINMQTPEKYIGDDEKLVSFVLFPWKGHRGRDVAGYIPVKNTIISATSSWQKERVELNDSVGVFEQQEEEPDGPKARRYRGRITKFSGVLKCYYASRTCTGTIAVRGWFQPFAKD